MNRACIRIAVLIGAILQASIVSAQGWDVLTPHLNAIEVGRQNAQTINNGSDSGPGFAADDLGVSLMSGLVSPTSQPATQAARSVDTGYRYSPTRTQQNLRSFLARAPNPAARAELEQMFAAQPNIIEDIRVGIRPYGLDSHKAADAYAMWWINAWLASEKRNVDTDRSTVEAVKRQVRNAFAATPDFAKTSDAERQEYAEALLIQGLMLAAALDQLDGNPQMLDQLAEAARKGAEASGVDLSHMTLTPNGFVPRKGK